MTKRANLRDDRSQTHSQIPYGHQTAFCKASPSGGGLVELVRRENEEEGGGIEGKKEVCKYLSRDLQPYYQDPLKRSF